MRDPGLQFVTVASTWHPASAWLIRNLLDDEGVDAIVADELMVATDWLTANAIGGVKVQVPRRQAQRAYEVLYEQSHDDFPPATTEDPGIPHCEECGSVEVAAERYTRRAAFLWWLFLGFPVPVASNRLRWLSCGHVEGQATDEEELVPQFQFSLFALMSWMTLTAILCGILRMGVLASAGFDPALGDR